MKVTFVPATNETILTGRNDGDDDDGNNDGNDDDDDDDDDKEETRIKLTSSCCYLSFWKAGSKLF